MELQKPKQGYKFVKSLFGKYEEILKDWEIKKFDELFDFLNTGTNSRSDLEKSGDIQYIHYGDIHTKWNSILDCDLEEIPWIDKNKVERLPLLKDGDLIIADASEDHEGSGTSILLKNVKNKKIVSGLHTIALRSIDENISSDFKTYLTSINFVKNQIIAYVTGISVYGLSKKNLKKVKIPLPTLLEQQKIASVLSNVDNLINQYDSIIGSTKKLKKGLMQQLLTKGIGHKKFKQVSLVFRFNLKKIPESWHTKKLLEVVDVVRGGSPRPAGDPKYFGGPINWITVAALTKDSKMYLDSVKLSLTEEGKNNSRFIEEGTLLLANSGATLGVPKITRISGCINDGIATFLNHVPSLSIEFLYHLLNSWITILRNINQGIGQPNLNTTIIENLLIPFPQLKEQQQIASILSETDLRISDLESKKTSLEQLKKGLMQKLLTGQILV